MKKGRRKAVDELRPEYRRSDFGKLVRGKYAARVARETNVVVLEPELAEAFPDRVPAQLDKLLTDLGAMRLTEPV